ncbi:MAG: tRNA (adenosine(37)-N6)-threonylcarbamoyltransferase complex dimerization subunit type 1 TsaB [Oscillospiraceae bacterium]
MNIFAIDSATRGASAAIYSDGRILSENFADIGLTHSQTLMELCDEVFRRSSLTPKDIDYFAATCGPGSFTGLRIGLGTVKGMAFAVGKPCIAVPTLEALAFATVPCERIVAPVLDARRGRVYCAQFDAGTKTIRRTQDSVLTYSELGVSLEGKRVLFIGDAAEICYNELCLKLDCEFAPQTRSLPRASFAAAAAAERIERGLVCSAAELALSYIQIPQAERVLKERKQ